MNACLVELIAEEARCEIPASIRAFAHSLALNAGDKTAAVFFYGSSLRTGDLDGVLDFYVLVENINAWHRSRISAFANRILPPNVEYREFATSDRTLRAKIAVMTLGQFGAATRFTSYDTTIWARFSQPVAIAWSRDAAAHRNAVMLATRAVTTSSLWAAVLGPARGEALDFWRALYAATYATELRVERKMRSDEIVMHAIDRYEQLLEPAWRAANMAYAQEAGKFSPGISSQDRKRLRRSWAMRRLLGKPLNIARLLKAAFTFRGGASYLAWKTERHTQIPVDLTAWQKRHPILAAPRVLWRLWRLGALR